jgi:hypothetical protein
MGKELYRVRKSWDDSKSQIGAFASLKKAISTCEEAGEDYKVYSAKGTQMFPREKEEEVAVEVIEASELIEDTKEPIMVEIEIPEEKKQEIAVAEVVVEETPVEEIIEAEPAKEREIPDLKFGDKVMILPGSTFPTGSRIPDWMFEQYFYVRAIKESGNVVLGQKLTGLTFATVKGCDLEKYVEIKKEIK